MVENRPHVSVRNEMINTGFAGCSRDQGVKDELQILGHALLICKRRHRR